jgi:hypothetical protein
VLKSKREKTGPLPQSLSSRELGPHQRLNARFKYSFSSIVKGLLIFHFGKKFSLFRRGEIAPEQLAARIVHEAREIGLQEDIQARSTLNVPPETVARDDVADDFITSLLRSRDPESTPENIFALASRFFDELD